MSTRRLSRGTVAGYSAGSIGTGGFSTLPGLVLLPYLTDEYGVAAGVAGLVVALPKTWDILFNPVVGRWSDRTRSRWGPRIPWMTAGAMALPLAFIVMFAGIPLGPSSAAFWVAVTFTLAASAFALFQVPYIAQPAEITDSYDERTLLMSWRIAALTFAILVFGGGGPALVNAAGGGLGGYRAMAVVCGLLFLLGMGACVLLTRRAPTLLRADSEGGFRDQVRAIRENREFRVLFTAFVLQALATSTMLAGVLYLAQWVLGSKGLESLLVVALVAPGILFIPMWRLIGKRWGKRTGFVAASVTFLVAALVLVAARSLPLAVVFVAVAAAGVGYAGLQLFPLAMLPDTIAADTVRTGHRRSGVFTGVWTAGETAGFALGPALFALVLSLGGYVSATAGDDVVQPDSAVTAIALGFSLVPALLIAVSVPVILRYALTEERLEAVTSGSPAPGA